MSSVHRKKAEQALTPMADVPVVLGLNLAVAQIEATLAVAEILEQILAELRS
jgi:hypothetical protein